jgi:hypothetical protein
LTELLAASTAVDQRTSVVWVAAQHIAQMQLRVNVALLLEEYVA